MPDIIAIVYNHIDYSCFKAIMILYWGCIKIV